MVNNYVVLLKHHMYEWNVLCYEFTDNELEIGSFKDLSKLTLIDSEYKSVVVNILVDTATMGSYRIRITGNPYTHGHMHITRLPNQNMSSLSTLQHFIRESLIHDPAKRTALVMGGHGSGWFLLTEQNSVLSIANFASTIQRSSHHFNLICLDACLMSCVETAYELRKCTDYILCYEDYCPWEGIIGPNFMSILNSSVGERTGKVARKLLGDFIQRVANIEDPADITLIKTKHLDNFAEFVRSLPLHHPADTSFCIDPDYWQLQDLTSIVKNSVSPEQFDQYNTLFGKVVRTYQQSEHKHNLNHHGLSMIADIEKDTYDTNKTWKSLHLSLKFLK